VRNAVKHQFRREVKLGPKPLCRGCAAKYYEPSFDLLLEFGWNFAPPPGVSLAKGMQGTALTCLRRN